MRNASQFLESCVTLWWNLWISQKSAAQSFCIAKFVVTWLLRKSTIANQVQSERAAFMSVALEWEILKKRTHKLGEERPLSIQRANSRVFPSNEKSWKKSAHHRISWKSAARLSYILKLVVSWLLRESTTATQLKLSLFGCMYLLCGYWSLLCKYTSLLCEYMFLLCEYMSLLTESTTATQPKLNEPYSRLLPLNRKS